MKLWLYVAAVPNLFGTSDQFHGRQFFHGPWGGGWFQDDSSALHLSCTLFLLLLHQFHLRSSGIRSWRLGASALSKVCVLFSVWSSTIKTLPLLCGNHQYINHKWWHSLDQSTRIEFSYLGSFQLGNSFNFIFSEYWPAPLLMIPFSFDSPPLPQDPLSGWLTCLFFFFNLFILIGGYLLYNIVVVLPYIDMNQPWVYMCSSSLPIPSLWVVPVHQPWAPCLMQRTWTGGLFHIW